MISTTQKYKQELIAGNRRYVVKANVTLDDGTTLLLTNQELWEQGVVISNGISSDSSFDIGTAIIGSLTLTIDNIKGNYNFYDFLNAEVVLWMGVENDVDEHDDQVYYRIGFYTVDDTQYNGSLITLSCLDNMTWFDVPFSEVTGITYPTTAGSFVADICAYVGVTLGTVAFQNYTMVIPNAPEGDINCREVLQYVAQKCCCYCKINTAGQLVLTWYDKDAILNIINYDGGSFYTHTTPYSDGCDLEGGHFNPWDGDNADGGTFLDLQQGAWLTQNYEMTVGTDEIVITGCRVRSTKKDGEYDELWVDPLVEADHERYVLVIENNPFITVSDAAATANIVGSILAGLPIRTFSSKSLNDVSYETGDMVRIIDFRGNLYYTWITNLTFTINNSESFSCGAQSIKQRKETRYSESAKTLVEAQANADKMLTDYDRAVQAMNDLAQDAIGYYKYQHTVSGAEVTWLHNGPAEDLTDPEHPLFIDSTVVFKISGDGVFISHDGGTTYDQGYDANSGTAILSLIYAVGISCDWIKTGTLTLGGNNNINGSLKILNSAGQQIGKWDKDGISASSGTFSGNLSAAGGTFAGNLSAAGGTFAGNLSAAGGTFSGNLSAAGGTFTGTLSAASGTMSDGSGTLSLSGGNLYMTNSDSGGAGVFAYKSGGSLYACWGAYKSSSRANGAYIDCETWDVIQAGINASDKRLKKNIKDLDGNFAKRLILGLKPKQFKFKKNKGLPDGLQFGVIAQEVKEIEDECGINEKNRLFYVQNDGSYAVEYRQLIAPIIKTIQMQQEEIDLLKQELAELKARID